MSDSGPTRIAARRIRSTVLTAFAVVSTTLIAVVAGPSLASTSGLADGAVPDGLTLFANDSPAVANLDPALLRAFRQAATNADRDGVEILVTSGWRSPKYQTQLLHQAISKYGSKAQA